MGISDWSIEANVYRSEFLTIRIYAYDLPFLLEAKVQAFLLTWLYRPHPRLRAPMSDSQSGSQVPTIRVNELRRNVRKQEHPRRSLKQLASVADKILHGIIIIEPLLPWERSSPLQIPAGYGGSRRKRSSGEESDTSINAGRTTVSALSSVPRPTVSRSPAPMGIPLPEDGQEPGLSHRRALYDALLARRRSGPSRAGMPLDISAAPGASLLDENEFEVCSGLRLYPLQYFQARDTLVGNWRVRGFYKKSAAQKMLHIDVNKTGKLYDYFVSRNWMPVSPTAADAALVRRPPDVDWHPIEPL